MDPNIFREPIESIEDISFSYNGEQFYFEYSIDGHCQLEEYFYTLKKGLRSSFQFGKFAYQSLITPFSITQSESVDKLCTLLQVYWKIIGASSALAKEKRSEILIRNKLKDLVAISSNIDDLASLVAKGLTIARRDYLVSHATLGQDEIMKIGPLVYDELKNRKLTDLQILALVDCKYVEASCLRNLAEKNWVPKQLPRVRGNLAFLNF